MSWWYNDCRPATPPGVYEPNNTPLNAMDMERSNTDAYRAADALREWPIKCPIEGRTHRFMIAFRQDPALAPLAPKVFRTLLRRGGRAARYPLPPYPLLTALEPYEVYVAEPGHLTPPSESVRAFWAGEAAPAFRVREASSSDSDASSSSSSSSSSKASSEQEEEHGAYYLSRQRSDATERAWLNSENEAEEELLEDLRDTERRFDDDDNSDFDAVGPSARLGGLVSGARFHRTAPPRGGRADPTLLVTTSDEEDAIDPSEMRMRRRRRPV
jgi:hypothetical protein